MKINENAYKELEELYNFKESNNINKLSSKILSIIVSILVFNLVVPNILAENIDPNYSLIVLIINSTGNISLFHSGYCVNHAPNPDEIYINDIKQTIINSYYYLNNTENTIKLIWKNTIYSTSCMFSGCSQINEINLSNFISSKVTVTDNMFRECKLLSVLNLSNFDTSKVTNMGNMFYNCRSLVSLNLSNFNTSKVTSMYGLLKVVHH